MSARTSLAAILTQLRLLIDDPAGASQMFTDDQLQIVLDQHAVQASYETLSPIENIASGGAVEYKKFISEHKFWEADAALVDGNYTTLTPTSSDYLAAKWTFSTSQNLPVLIYGQWFDINAAAAEAWELKAAAYANEYDSNVDGGSYSLSQKKDAALQMAAQFRSKSLGSSGNISLRRNDVAD